jgi:hypothetical protein
LIAPAETARSDRGASGALPRTSGDERLPQGVQTAVADAGASVVPEIERRVVAGALAPDKLPFPVRQFRYVQRSGKSFVEINDEVKIKAQVRVTRALAVGEPMTLSDMHADECFLQPPEVDGKPAA